MTETWDDDDYAVGVSEVLETPLGEGCMAAATGKARSGIRPDGRPL